MPDDDPTSTSTAPDKPSPNQQEANSARRKLGSIFSIPPPVKRVFDKFPLVTYDANELPLRAPRERERHVLHVFTTKEEARSGKPSFNPACLKWQAYLRFCDVAFRTVPSTNHASPSGVLPFLLPAVPASDPAKAQDPVPSNKLRKWIASQKGADKRQESGDLRYEAYASLVDNRIRKAWLFQLYLNPSNSPLLHRLYVEPSSSNPFVQMTIAYQLRCAAETELVKSSASTTIIEADIMRAAEEAFDALSSLLGEDQWFFGQDKPGLFDASVFAYTHLLLDDGMQWEANGLKEMLNKHENLVQHKERVVEMYF